MEKFTIGQPINYLQLVDSISNFVHKVKTKPDGPYQALQLKHRSNLFHNNDIDFNFLNHCILHCVIQQLNSAIEDLDQNLDTNISQKMRQFYFKMSTQGGWKKEFDFQQTIVCVTKMIAQFYNDTFTNVSSNSKLQSQIFIILIHTLMGINVGMKCFQMLQKKYLKQKDQKRIVPIDFMNARKTFMSKITSRDSMFMYSTSNIANTNSYFSKIKEVSKDETQQFKQMIKQNLYIDPLPKIKKSKKSIEAFVDEDGNHFRQRFSHGGASKQYEKQIRKKPMYSTQISLSLKSQIQKRHVSIAENNRPFKIKHRTPFHSSHIVVFKNNLIVDDLNLIQQHPLKQKQQSNKFNSSQWEKQIKGIKQKVNLNESFKFNEKKIKQKEFQYEKGQKIKQNKYLLQNQKFQSIDNNDMKEQIGRKLHIRKTMSSNSCFSSETIKTIAEKQKQNIQLSVKNENIPLKKRKNSSVHQIQQNTFTRLDYGVKNYRQVVLAQNFNPNYFQKPKKNAFNPAQLKQKKSLFNLSSKQRRNKIQYSMFMLPSMRIQFNK